MRSMLRQWSLRAFIPAGRYLATRSWNSPTIPIELIKKLWVASVVRVLEAGGNPVSVTTEHITGEISELLDALAGTDRIFSVSGHTTLIEKQIFSVDAWVRLSERSPEIASALENARMLVHTEIRLRFQTEFLEAIEGYLKAAGYKKWTPNFLKRHKDGAARGLHAWVRTHLKGLNGRVDWFALVQHLSLEAQQGFSTIEISRPLRHNELIPALSSILDELITLHGYWTPATVGQRWKNLYERLREEFRMPANRPDLCKDPEEGSRPNWVFILSQLSTHHRSKFRWRHGHATIYRDESYVVEEVVGVLTQLEPERWGPHWMEDVGLSGARIWWSKNFRTPDDRINWSRLLQQIPTHLRSGWSVDDVCDDPVSNP